MKKQKSNPKKQNIKQAQNGQDGKNFLSDQCSVRFLRPVIAPSSRKSWATIYWRKLDDAITEATDKLRTVRINGINVTYFSVIITITTYIVRGSLAFSRFFERIYNNHRGDFFSNVARRLLFPVLVFNIFLLTYLILLKEQRMFILERQYLFAKGDLDG